MGAVRNILFLSKDAGGALLAERMLELMEVAGFQAHAAATQQYAQTDLAGRYILRSMGVASCSADARSWMEFASPDAVRLDFVITLSRESAHLYTAISSRRLVPVLPIGGEAFSGGVQSLLDGSMLRFPGNPVWLDWSRELDQFGYEGGEGQARTLLELLGKRVEYGRRLYAQIRELVRMPVSRERTRFPVTAPTTVALAA